MSDLPPARLLEVEPDAYHKLPQFSASLAKIAIRQSIAHARDAYERQLEELADVEDGDDSDEPTPEKVKKLERGSVYHAKLLGKGKRIEVISKEKLGKNGAYSTDVAKAARDDARARGLIPVKYNEVEIHERVTGVLRSRLADAGHTLDGTSEVAIEWHEPTEHGHVACRAMLDHLQVWGLDGRGGVPEALVTELKIVDDASPARSERTAESLGYAIGAAAYTRALAVLEPRLAGRITYQFLFCEVRRPYAIYSPRPDGAFMELGVLRWRRAIEAWGRGLATGQWPAYTTPTTSYITASKWVLDKEGIPTEL